MNLKRSNSGVTLIELIIAVTLVSLLSTGMMMAIRLGLTSMEKTNEHINDNRKILSVNRIIDSQIGGIMAVKADCLASGANGLQIPFFQGEPDTMRFVSTYSLSDASRGYPMILEFHVVPGPQGARLIVNESIYAGPSSTGRFCSQMAPNPLIDGQPAPAFIPVQTGSNSFVLIDRLASCRMLYREELKEPPYEKWWPVWNKPLLPSAIRIELQPERSAILRLPLVSITAPIRVTRNAMVPYVGN